jgi:thiamine biosynthesis lipoprotein
MKSASNKLIRARPLLGTFVEIAAEGAATAQVEGGIEAAFAAVKRVHERMSFHDAGSDVWRLNGARPGETVVVADWTYRVLEMALDLQRRSDGRFNIAIASALQLIGLLPSTPHASLATAPATCTLALLGDNRVRLCGSAGKIDLGGIAKGFAVDRAVDALREHGIAAGIVNAGGDLAAFGPDAQIVAVRDPRDPGRAMCDVPVNNAALASSGLLFDPVEAFTAPYSAIIDPLTCQPVNAICGATVRASCCWLADALTKVVMVAGTAASEVLDYYEASALLVMANGEVLVTPRWQDACSVAA